MTTTTTDRVRIPVYAIKLDHFDGRLRTRYAFEPLGTNCVHHTNGLDLIVFDELDGGLAGHLTAPAGTTTHECEGGPAVFLPGERIGTPLGDAVALAKSEHRVGFGWSPAK
jgi:hypothetical protein